jgi:phospholipase/carboxylesterase
LDHRVLHIGTSEDKGPVILLLHGMGSNEGGMLKLASILPKSGIVYALRAPYMLEPGKFSWYEVDFSTGTPSIRFDEAEKSRALIRTFIQGIRVRHDMGVDKVIVGGFSQGGVMSYNVGLTSPEMVKGIFILGSRLPPEIRPFMKSAEELKNLKIFIGHGNEDRVLPLSHAHEALDHLRALGLQPEGHEYAMGHTIGPEMVEDLKRWMTNFI